MFSKDLKNPSSKLSSSVDNRHVENTLCPLLLKKIQKSHEFADKNSTFSASTHHKKMNDGLNEASILCL